MRMHCTCTIVPKDVLRRLSQDHSLPADVRQAMADSATLSEQMRQLRQSTAAFTAVAQGLVREYEEIAPAPQIAVYNCKHKSQLPGVLLPDPGHDEAGARAGNGSADVAKFYADVFGRNSVDNAGMTLVSSVHYGRRYMNAMWNGQQMVYGDGDGQIFVDFTKAGDVIGHELTHGVTQYTLQLGYSDDAGGLNESISDCFGSMFRQWRAKQAAGAADWLIGKEIMGPGAVAKGLTCLRDMRDPAAKHCLAPQPTHYSDLKPGMDPHYTSGPPNLAFTNACLAFPQEHSWDRIGQVWYLALTSGVHPTMTMPQFATQTLQAVHHLKYGKEVETAVRKAWASVGL